MTEIDWPAFLENGLPLEQKKTSLTVGVFDGVHRGHQALIANIVSYNAEYVPVVVTFREPKIKDSIQSFRQKAEMLESLGVKILVVIDFTESFKQIKGIEFLEILLKHGNLGFFTVGGSFRCGYQLDTSAQEIKTFFTSHNVPVTIFPEVMEGSLPVSSSRIRSAINSGDLRLAEVMLGRPFSLEIHTC
ncbi:MAG: FAD synthetase family protein [Spirochaetes bacterium]|nr:FAD synthetase family protein [Brevinematales bacterium]MCL1959441.1 FAD synthetase family protein [Spirochaetota bacterium]